MSHSTIDLTRRGALAVLGSATVGIATRGIPCFGQQTSGDHIEKLLPTLTEKSRTLLRQLLGDPKYSGRIPAEDAATLASNEHLGPEQLMLALIPLAQSYSQAPISNFHVGVVMRGVSGALYTGANIEIPGQCLGFAVHAEQAALASAYMHEESGVTAVAVGGAPCGHCRQFIEEMSPDGEILIVTPKNPPRKLSSILPEPFSPAALGMTHGAFPIPYTNLSSGGFSGDPLVFEALNAARRSYAPYSNSPSGVALRTSSRRIYRGSYIENVAFNPSLSPLQVALAGLIASGENYSSISGAALVEAQGASISQRAVTETVLGAIAPSANLLYTTAPR
jgi:cytidine deaminase